MTSERNPERGAPMPMTAEMVFDHVARKIQLEPIEGSAQDLRSLYLGRAANGRFRDQNYAPSPAQGITLEVNQTSYGSTGVCVLPKEGFEVAALHWENSKPAWKAAEKRWDDVLAVEVAFDRGNMHKTDVHRNWSGIKFGNPGIRAGLVRVTESTTGEQKYYTAGADFSGREDSWFVDTAIVEVNVIDPRFSS